MSGNCLIGIYFWGPAWWGSFWIRSAVQLPFGKSVTLPWFLFSCDSDCVLPPVPCPELLCPEIPWHYLDICLSLCEVFLQVWIQYEIHASVREERNYKHFCPVSLTLIQCRICLGLPGLLFFSFSCLTAT